MTSPTATRPMRADARRNYDRLLGAARAAFTEHGAGASLDDIARRAGVGPGTLYRHFPTREALIEAVIGDAADGLERRGTELLEADDPQEALVTWLRALLEYTATIHGLPGTLMANQDDEGSALRHSCSAIGLSMDALVARAQAAGGLRADVQGDDLGRLLHGISLAAEASSDPPATIERLLAIALDGVRTRS